MNKLYLIGIAKHWEYRQEYLDLILDSKAKDVFIEETNNSRENSLQKELYLKLTQNNLNLIPVYPDFNIKLDNAGVSKLELVYAININNYFTENKDYCFTVGGMHLSPDKSESSLEFALKKTGCKAEIVSKNYLEEFPQNYKKTINKRKKIIEDLISKL